MGRTVARLNKMGRTSIVADVVKGIRQQSWSKIDCVVFPGGFFFLPKYIGNLSYENRVSIIEAMDFSNTMRVACSELQEFNPGLSVVAGVDLVLCPDGRDRGPDQTCVAWGPDGITGIGRKVFPVPGGDGKKFVSYLPDFSTVHRLINLPSGGKAVLCACYDLFGCSESLEHHTNKTKYIVCIEKNGNKFEGGRREFLDLRDKCVDLWHKLLVSHNVNVGIAAIHYFNKPGLDLFRQRHGIATCSAALAGWYGSRGCFFP